MINENCDEELSKLTKEVEFVMKKLKLRDCVDNFISALVRKVFCFSSIPHEEAFRCILAEEMMGIFANLLEKEEELKKKMTQDKTDSSHLRLVR